MLEHVSDKSDDMETCEGLSVSFVIFDKPTATGGPGKGPFNNPAPRQEDKAAFGFRQFDHLEGNAFCGRGFGCRIAGVALIDIRGCL